MKRSEVKAHRRQQIIAATIRTLTDMGWEDTTFAQIAKRAQLSRGLITFHFETKEKLLLDVLEYLYKQYSHPVEVTIASGADPWETLVAAIQVDFQPGVWNKNSIVVWQIFRTQARTNQAVRKILQRMDDAMLRRCVELVTHVVEDRMLDGVDPERIALLWFALTLGMRNDTLISARRFNRAKAEVLCLEFLSTALA